MSSTQQPKTAKSSDATIHNVSPTFLVRLWLLAFLVRLIGVALGHLVIPHWLVPPDAHGAYYPIAQSLASGEGYTINGDALDASRVAPGFPVWLAGLMMIGGTDLSTWFVGVFNAALRAGGVVILFLLANRCFGRNSAWWAACLYLIDPWETFWVGIVLKGGLAVPLFLLAIWLISKTRDYPVWQWAWATGAAIGVAGLTRFPSLILWPVAGLLLVLAVRTKNTHTRYGLGRASLIFLQITLAMLVTLSPWLIRNRQVTGQPILSTHFAGRYFYTSNGPGVEMVKDGYNDPDGINQEMLDKEDRTKPPVQREVDLFTRTLGHVLSHPQELGQRLLTRLRNTWQPTFPDSSLRNWFLLALPYCVLLTLSLLGIGIAFYKRIPCSILLIPLLAMVLAHMVFWGEIRNRQYMMPMLYAFGGLTVHFAIRWRTTCKPELPTAETVEESVPLEKSK